MENTIILSVCSLKFCILSIVFVFSWDRCKSQEKLETMLMQNLGGQTKSIMVFSEVAYYSFSNGCTCPIFLMTEVLQTLQNAKTLAIPLGNHVKQQKLTEATKNRSALTKTPNFGILGSFRYILVYLGVISARSSTFRYHSCSFHFIPVLFCLRLDFRRSLEFGYPPREETAGRVSDRLCL